MKIFKSLSDARGQTIYGNGLTMNLRPKFDAILTLDVTSSFHGALALFAWSLMSIIACPVEAQLTQSSATTGSSSRSDRRNAVAAIPFQDLNESAQAKLKSVIGNPSFYRRLPVTQIDADPEHVRFLIRHPDVVVAIWRLMGVTQLQAERTGPFNIKTDDGAGTVSQMELIYGNDDLHVYYGSGSYAGNLLKRRLTGKFVVVTRTASQPNADGTFRLAGQLDVFLKVDNATAAFITRTVQPIVGSTADYNFVESMKFIERLNQTARSNASGFKGMNERLNVTTAVRQKYDSIIDVVASRSSQIVSQRLQSSDGMAMQNQVRSKVSATRPQQVQPLYSPAANQAITGRVTSRVGLNGQARSTARLTHPAPPITRQPQRTPAIPRGADSPQPVTPQRLPGYSVLVGGPRKSLLTQQRSARLPKAPARNTTTGIRQNFSSAADPTQMRFTDSQDATRSPASVLSIQRR